MHEHQMLAIKRHDPTSLISTHTDPKEHQFDCSDTRIIGPAIITCHARQFIKHKWFHQQTHGPTSSLWTPQNSIHHTANQRRHRPFNQPLQPPQPELRLQWPSLDMTFPITRSITRPSLDTSTPDLTHHKTYWSHKAFVSRGTLIQASPKLRWRCYPAY